MLNPPNCAFALWTEIERRRRRARLLTVEMFMPGLSWKD